MENTTNANDLAFRILCINSTQHLKDNISFNEPIVKLNTSGASDLTGMFDGCN